jgi:hypothetical protein
MKILTNSWKKSRMAITLVNCKLRSKTWYNFVRIGVLHMTSYSYSKFGILEFSWITILRNSWKKSGMAITLAKFKLESDNWYHFVRIGVLHMTSYPKIWVLASSWIKILKISWKKSLMAITLDKHMPKSCNWYHFVFNGVYQMISNLPYSLPKLYSFLGRYEESFYAPLDLWRCQSARKQTF